MTPNKTLPEKVLIDGAPAEELKVSAEVLLEEDVAVALVSSALSVAVEIGEGFSISNICRNGSSGGSIVGFRDLLRIFIFPSFLDGVQDWLTVSVNSSNIWSCLLYTSRCV